MSEKPFKVNLAATIKDEAEICFPVFVSPKLDGIRCYIKDGVALSRSNKPLPNKHLQNIVAGWKGKLDGLDGELIVGDPTADDVYRKTNSAVMSIEGEPEFVFFVFDDINNSHLPYSERISLLKERTDNLVASRMLEVGSGSRLVELLVQFEVTNEEYLAEVEQSALKDGFEGLILRSPNAQYKQGRSTMKGDQGVMKLKRFLDAEAKVLGFEEQMFNGNEAKTNELGHTSRSSCKENLVPKGTLGALVCVTEDGVGFKIGTGFDDETKQHIWDNQDQFLGQTVKYKFFPVGIKEAPRHPVFLGWRSELDMQAFLRLNTLQIVDIEAIFYEIGV